MTRCPDRLEPYALKAGYGPHTGVAVACHAIADAFLLQHAGVGCKTKAGHLDVHDWEKHCSLRQGWTELAERDLIHGSAERIGPYVRTWQKRHGAGFVAVTTATFVELTGEDFGGAVAAAARSLGPEAEAQLIVAGGGDGDEADGYAAVLAALLRRIEWDRVVPRRGQVSVAGYWFDRYEGDHLGNLLQLDSLLSAVGCTLGTVLLSGRTWRDHLAAAESAVLVKLPYLRPVEAELSELWAAAARGRAVVQTDLPIGIAGTSRWLRQVAAAAGADGDRVESFIKKRERQVRAPLRKLASRWRFRRTAVFAEPPLAAGLCGLLLELGMQPVLVGLRGRSLGGEDELRRALGRSGLELPEGVEIRAEPSLAFIRHRILTLLRERRLDGAIGSATELGVIRSLSPAEVAPGGHLDRGPFLLEVGFPCERYHALRPMPFMGYGGVSCFAQRLLDAAHLWDSGQVASE